MKMLSELLWELQEIYDEVGECKVHIDRDYNLLVFHPVT